MVDLEAETSADSRHPYQQPLAKTSADSVGSLKSAKGGRLSRVSHPATADSTTAADALAITSSLKERCTLTGQR